MARLSLVRHAQASFLSQNYDQLSAVGEAQARLLGEYWAHHHVVFDRVGTGPALRHRHTGQLVAEAYRQAHLVFPASFIAKEFDEFPGEVVLSESLPQLLANNPEVRDLHDAMQKASTDAAKRATFQRLFQVVISLWVREEIKPKNVESWQDFCARVNRGLSNFLADATRGETAVIFTSGGPISVAVQRALHLSAQDTLEIAWMQRNCSFTEFLFSGNRFMLSSFNSFPHLGSEALLTYR
jgi:broad specificity phosphatase PhoE